MTFVNSSLLAAGSAANAAVPVPSGGANLTIAAVGLYMESAAVITGIPSGFTNKVSLQTSATSRGRLDVFWKRLTGVDSGTYTFSWTGSTFRAAACGLWSGRKTSGDPFDNFVLGTGSAESTTTVASLNVSASPVAAGGDAVAFGTNFNGGGQFNPAPTNYTERQDLAVLGMDTRDNIAAGATGNVTVAHTVTDFMKAFLGVLAPAGATVIVPSTRSQYAGFY